jgi:hypothetical protein
LSTTLCVPPAGYTIGVCYNGDGTYSVVKDVKEGDVDWESGEGVRMGGRLSERDGSLLLEGFVGDRLISANIAVVNDSLHIFTPV